MIDIDKIKDTISKYMEKQGVGLHDQYFLLKDMVEETWENIKMEGEDEAEDELDELDEMEEEIGVPPKAKQIGKPPKLKVKKK